MYERGDLSDIKKSNDQNLTASSYVRRNVLLREFDSEYGSPSWIAWTHQAANVPGWTQQYTVLILHIWKLCYLQTKVSNTQTEQMGSKES